MLKVVIASPYRGDVDLNVQYAIACMKDSLERGEAPFAGHLLYTQILADENPAERAAGILAGREWIEAADMMAVYTDFGISKGMQDDMSFARRHRIQVIYRAIPSDEIARIKGE